MTSSRSRDDHPSSSRRSAFQGATTSGNGKSGASASSAIAVALPPAVEPLRPYLGEESAGIVTLGEAYPSFAGPSAFAGRRQDIPSATSDVPQSSQGQHRDQPQGVRRPPGAIPISDLLSESSSSQRRQSISSSDLQHRPFGATLPSPGSASSSPTHAREQPSSGRRGFFDPARNLETEDVFMTDAPASTSPYQASFPTRSAGYPTAIPAQASSTEYAKASTSGASAA